VEGTLCSSGSRILHALSRSSGESNISETIRTNSSTYSNSFNVTFEGRNPDGELAPMEGSLRYLYDRTKGCDELVETEYYDLLRYESLSKDENCQEEFEDEDVPEEVANSSGTIHSKVETSSSSMPNENANDINSWLKRIQAEVQSIVAKNEGYRSSSYYSQEIAKNFLRVSREFTIRSAVLVEPFKSPSLTPSSAPMESEFRTRKEVTLKGVTKPVRADKLVAQHLHALEGQYLIASTCKDEGKKSARWRDSRQRKTEPNGKSKPEEI